MLTFWQAQNVFADRRKGRSEKKLATATVLVKLDDETFAVKYHNTYVVKIHFDGTFTLNSGGWQTATTKKRINEYSSANVFQKSHEWYVTTGVPFSDNCKVNAAGELIS